MNYEAKVDLAGAQSVDEEHASAGSSRKRTIIVAALIVLALIAGVALMHMGKGEESAFPASEGEQVPTVSVVAPGRATVEGTIHATGTLAARRPMPVGVVGEGGRVVSVRVEPGDWVNAGAVLAVIDRSVQEQLTANATAQIDVAQADANLAQANLDRALKLVDRGFISQADVDRLTATRDAAVARVKVARAQLGERRARNAQLNIVAPAAGLVLTRAVEPGQVVTSGSGTLFSIAKGGEMELLANMGEDDLAAVSVGATATVRPVGGDQAFSGRIWQIAPTIAQEDRQGTARIALPYDKALRPGGFASAEISRGATVAPRLPESAIMSDEKGSYVYVVNKDNHVERRNVTTGIVTADGITVTGGLTGQERIVTRAGGFLNPGDLVKPVLVKQAD